MNILQLCTAKHSLQAQVAQHSQLLIMRLSHQTFSPQALKSANVYNMCLKTLANYNRSLSDKLNNSSFIAVQKVYAFLNSKSSIFFFPNKVSTYQICITRSSTKKHSTSTIFAQKIMPYQDYRNITQQNNPKCAINTKWNSQTILERNVENSNIALCLVG